MSKLLASIFIIVLVFVFSQINLHAQNQASPKETAKDYYLKGKELFEKKRYNEALTYFQTSLIYDSDNYEYLDMAAFACLNLDLYANADYYFHKVAKLSKGKSHSHTNIGVVQVKTGNDKQAFEYFEKAINYRPNHACPLSGMGALLMRYGKYNEAKNYLYKAIKYNKKKPDALVNLGTIHYRTNNIDSALYYYNKAVEYNPNYMEACIAKGAILKETDKPQEEYAELCNKLINTYSNTTENGINNYEAISMRVEAYKILGKNSEMTEDLKHKLQKLNQLIELHPEAYTFIKSRGDTFLNLGDKENAIINYKKVLEINPEYEYVEKKLHKITSN